MKKVYFLIAITFVVSFLKANNGLASRDSRAAVSPLPPVSCIAREDEYDVKFYWLDLDLEDYQYGGGEPKISGNSLTRALVVAQAGMDTFSLELVTSFTADSAEVQLNGGGFQTAAVIRDSGTAIDVLLPAHAALNDLVEVRVYYHGFVLTPSFGNPGGDGYFEGYTGYLPDFSASPPYNSSTWWPCKQSLTDKADSSWFFITTDTPNIAVSNGLLVNTVDVAGGKRQFQWESHHAIDFYLISFVVGPMTDTVQYFHPTGRTDSMQVHFYNTSPSYTLDVLQRFSDKFGLYPFYDEKFGLAGVYLGGGMENQTIVSLGFAGTVIEHETTHMWFGDNVTCASYKELWLNEGFARWGESLYPELSSPDSASANNTRISICSQYEYGNLEFGALGALAYPSTSIYYYNTDTTTVAALYGGGGRDMNYEKAAMMINTLRFVVNNDSIFFLGLRNYQTQYGGQAAHTNDLMDAMENTTGIDLTQFFNQWFWGYGFPTFNVHWKQGQNQLALEVIEHASDSLKTPLFETPLQIKAERLFHADTGWQRVDTTVRVNISQISSNFQFPSNNADSVIGILVDPNVWVLNDPGLITYDTSLIITGVKAIEEASKAFNIYPNPASDYLNVRSNLPYNQPVTAELYNAVGQRVLSTTLKPYDRIDLQGLPGGVYFLQLNRLYSYKVIVTN